MLRKMLRVGTVFSGAHTEYSLSVCGALLFRHELESITQIYFVPKCPPKCGLFLVLHVAPLPPFTAKTCIPQDIVPQNGSLYTKTNKYVVRILSFFRCPN